MDVNKAYGEGEESMRQFLHALEKMAVGESIWAHESYNLDSLMFDTFEDYNQRFQITKERNQPYKKITRKK